MSYSRLFTYFQSTCRSIYYPIAIAGCYVAVSTSNAQAQIQSIASSNGDRLDPRAHQTGSVESQRNQCRQPLQLNSHPEPAAAQPQFCSQTSAQNLYPQRNSANSAQFDRVAQIIPVNAIPFALPIQLSPAFSTPIPPSDPLIPLNSILVPTLIAPNNTPAVPLINAPKPPQPTSIQDARFIVPPQVLPPQQVDPFSTQFVLNGDKISHLTPTVAKSGFESGNFRTSDLNFNVYQILRADNIQSVTKDSVVRVNSHIESVGIRSVAQNRQVTTTTIKPQTLLGARQQISLDANCRDNSGQTCTYLPGIAIDESTIDPRTLQPTGVQMTSQYGDIISPASVAAIRSARISRWGKWRSVWHRFILASTGLGDYSVVANCPLDGDATRRSSCDGGDKCD